jgi:catechol 2,3-dioxygenase-like lactoylglutathione lyase family enzyme
MSSQRIVVKRIEHVAVIVSDIDRAKYFYGQVLGLTEVPRPKSFDFPGAWYRNGPTDLHLISRSPIDAESRRHVAFYVADLQVAAQVLQAHGYTVLWENMKIEGLDRFFTHDPDKNRIEIMASERK